MTFKKLALASAIAMVPTVGFSAMVELEDATLSDVTGQDGIEIDIATAAPISANIYIHDQTGLAPGGAGANSFDAAIVIESFSFAGNISIDIDAGDSVVGPAAATPTLQINVSIPTATIITGNIRVANSQRDEAGSGWGIGTTSAVLLNTMTIAMSGLTLNIQLGNEPQGNMIAINSTITGGLTINNFAMNDAGGAVTGGAIGALATFIDDNGAGTNLTVNVNANASTAGLVLNLTQLGSATGMDIRMENQYLGTTTAGLIGDIAIVGLNLNGTTVTISGK
ncbi:MAG: DUF6160 family protein [Pseudomonadota bacterium]